ncbi:ABC transporter ATP-binding protein [Nocardia sp. NPDC004860]|uniref:ABC transporter ATP-binding protein n=1 Tax=Nocardia sp. NPDC004860 TaxID=3154557 RepID=UPI0033A657AF
MIRKLLTVVGPEHRSALRHMLAALVIGAVLQGIAFALLVPILKTLFGSDPGSVLWPWMYVLLVVLVLYAVEYYVSLQLGVRVGAALSKSLHTRLGDTVASLPLGWFGADRVGMLGQLATKSVMDIMGVPAHLLRPLVNTVVTPATVIVALYVFDWRLAVAVTLTVPVIVLVYRWSLTLSGRADAARAAARAETGGRVVEFAQLQPVLRVFGRGAGDRLLEEALRTDHRTARRVLATAVPGLVGLSVAVQASFTIVIALGVYLVLDRDLAPATLVAVLVLAARFTEPITELAVLGSTLKSAGGALDRVLALLDEPVLPEPLTPATPAGNEIRFESVEFGYGDTPVLRDVSFVIPEGTTTALIGPSGSGKTTVSRLIGRFWDVNAGRVTLGGVDIRSVAGVDLMARLSVVFQDVYLFEDTLEENIRLGRPNATDAQVRAAAEAARVTEIVDRLPDGWATRVGEGGASLSGGERQRVSIARAILKNAPIVLLDEATAALDAENERAVHDALATLTADRTVLVIAHRLHTVMHADQILFLDNGEIAERGTHDELLSADGRYAGFWAQRHRARNWSLT